MRLALVGGDANGVELARAFQATGRHQFLSMVGASLDAVPQVHDLEEVLADPAVEAVIIAGRLDQRAAQVRRALQSERIVLCCYPPDSRPDGAYEAGMLQQDTRQILLPLMPNAFHPAVLRLKELLSATVSAGPSDPGIMLPPPGNLEEHYKPADIAASVQLREPVVQSKGTIAPAAEAVLGELQLIEVEHWSLDEVLQGTDIPGALPCLPGWDVLRAMGGEIAEVSALTWGETIEPGLPVLLTGRFEKAGLLQGCFLPRQAEDRLRLRLRGSKGTAELVFPQGFRGPSTLVWQASQGDSHEESWDTWNPWPSMVEVIEDVMAAARSRPRGRSQDLALSWQDAIRCLELDDAARRSVQKRRVAQMEYPEASEEVTFKGTMTLVGCALLWGIILLVILSRWVSWLGWAVGPVLGIFLLLQLLRWIIPSLDPDAKKETKP
jgi:predicted dehydrogenase